jgi:XTP/dITP diphosphohydrolase
LNGRLVLATRNTGKVREIREILSDVPVQLYTLLDFPDLPETPEDGETFQENAAKKARAATIQTGLPVLADDSGLEVDALNGAPGVFSARFAGEGAGDLDNNRKVLELLGHTPDDKRTARFRCVLALATPGGDIQTADGTCEGRITTDPRGDAGFGYDPLFIPVGYQKTFGELGYDIKNRLSHRAIALRKIKPLLFDIFKGV